MKNITALLLLAALLLAASCGSSKSGNPNGEITDMQAEMDERNSAVIPLITRIRRLPGISIQNGVPVLSKSANSMSGSQTEPLYVLDGLAMGNSFRQIENVVQPVDVKSIKVLRSSDASFYGSRGANGVIVITTKSGG